jgi:predicted dehydrogenase
MSGKLFHAPFINNHPGFELTAIVERTKNESRIKYPNSKLYHSVEELLNDDSISLVIVNTPTYTHFEYAKAALNAGKNVVVEKPMVVSSNEADELITIANKNGLLLSVYQNRRYDGDYRAVKDVVEQDLLGELKEVEMRFDRYRPAPSGKVHKEGKLPGSGTLYDLGSHLIDQALQLFGSPQAVFADIWTMRNNVDADDYFELLLFYERVRVRIKCSTIARETNYAYVLHGIKGSFLQQRSDIQEQQLLEGNTPTLGPWCSPPAEPDGILNTEIREEHSRTKTTSMAGNYMLYFDELYNALINHTPNPVPAEDGSLTIKIIEKAIQSSDQKRIINI